MHTEDSLYFPKHIQSRIVSSKGENEKGNTALMLFHAGKGIYDLLKAPAEITPLCPMNQNTRRYKKGV